MKRRAAVAIAGFAAASLLATVLVHGTEPTDAAWVKTEKRSSVVTATALVPPTGLTCATGGTYLLGRTATITWTAASSPGPYIVAGWDATNSVWKEITRVAAPTPPTEPSFVFSSGLLDGLLGGLLGLLFGAGPTDVAVRSALTTTANTGWQSELSVAKVKIRKATTGESLLGGFVCVP